MLSVIESRNVWWVIEKAENEASSITAHSVPSNRTGMAMMFRGVDAPSPELIRT